MSGLIDELKQEHAAIAETLKNVRDLGVTSQEGQETLLAAKTGLLAHLKKEDEQLYPILIHEAKQDGSLQRTLDALAREMHVITQSALEFFTRYAQGGSGTEFTQDFGKLSATISQRIRKEERTIYVCYEALTS